MERREITIQGHKYTLDTMSPLDAAPFGLRVASLIGSAIENLSGGKNAAQLSGLLASVGDGKDAKITEDKIMGLVPMLMGVLARIDMAEVSRVFAYALGKGVACEAGKLGNEQVFDEWFSRHPGDYYPVAIWATWEHSRDFLAGSLAGLRDVFLPAGARSALQSPTAGPSTTSSSGSAQNIAHIPILKPAQ